MNPGQPRGNLGEVGSVSELARMTWEEVRDVEGRGALAILPVGAVEAHGPHLPLDTDVIIARAMAEEGAARLKSAGLHVLVLPPVSYTPAPFAADFPGTISLRPETLRRMIEDIRDATVSRAVTPLVLSNAHLDPAHVGVLRGLAANDPRIVFPDVTRRRWAERLTDEFRSGACHAGRYETSIVLSAAPDSVRQDLMAELEPVPHSLSEAIQEGKRTFLEVGGTNAYFGYPAEASAEEGRRTIEILGEILEEAVMDALGPDHRSDTGRNE